MKFALCFFACLSFTSSVYAADPLRCTDGSEAHAAVMDYLSAMHNNHFTQAYDYVSSNMTDGRSREQWSELQAKAYPAGKVQIYGVDARSALAADGDAACTKAAIVPNVLSSKDKLNEHGLVEFEIYTVKLVGDRRAIDEQRTLFEEAEVDMWFPSARSSQ